MNLYDKLSEKEISMMDSYIFKYGYKCKDNPNHTKKCDLKYWLRAWADAKSDLFNMFGGELILKKPFTYNRPAYEITKEISKAMRHDGDMYEFESALGNLVVEGDNRSLHRSWATHSKMYDILCRSDVLAENVYHGVPFTFPLPNGKVLNVERGCKPMKKLAAVAKAYNLPGFEKFRIAHSQCLNQKKFTGTMCLSIHPMDFMTMSDNNCGWESCMSWRNDGCYHRGTIECMNSKYVIVAYLESEHLFFPCNNEEYTWSNKKWRSLYLVDDHIMTGIKGYPYQEDAFDTFVLNWLRELRPDRKYTKPLSYERDGYGLYIPARDHNDSGSRNQKPTYWIDLTTGGAMYCDFGSIIHKGVFSDDDRILYSKDNDRFNCYTVDYSGPALCIHCGEEHDYYGDESCLCCCDCSEEEILCCCCECHFSESDVEQWEGRWYCTECLENNYPRSPITDERNSDEDVCTLYVIPDFVEVPETLTGNSDQPICRYIFGGEGLTIDNIEENILESNDVLSYPEVFKPNAKIEVARTRYGAKRYVVRASQMQESFLIGYMGYFATVKELTKFIRKEILF